MYRLDVYYDTSNYPKEWYMSEDINVVLSWYRKAREKNYYSISRLCLTKDGIPLSHEEINELGFYIRID